MPSRPSADSARPDHRAAEQDERGPALAFPTPGASPRSLSVNSERRPAPPGAFPYPVKETTPRQRQECCFPCKRAIPPRAQGSGRPTSRGPAGTFGLVRGGRDRWVINPTGTLAVRAWPSALLSGFPDLLAGPLLCPLEGHEWKVRRGSFRRRTSISSSTTNPQRPSKAMISPCGS